MDSLGVGAVTWSPLAGGVLSGKYMDDAIPEDSRASLNVSNLLLSSACEYTHALLPAFQSSQYIEIP